MTTNNLPSFRSYGNYSSSNYGAHCLCFTYAHGNDFYFSYDTLIAFRNGKGLICRQNDWGTTTGKHLNLIQPNKKSRVDSETFERMFKESFPS